MFKSQGPHQAKAIPAISEVFPDPSEALRASSEAPLEDLSFSFITVIVPYGAAAQTQIKFNFNETSGAEEIADHVTLFRLFFFLCFVIVVIVVVINVDVVTFRSI